MEREKTADRWAEVKKNVAKSIEEFDDDVQFIKEVNDDVVFQKEVIRRPRGGACQHTITTRVPQLSTNQTREAETKVPKTSNAQDA